MRDKPNEKGITPAALFALAGGDLGNFFIASTPGGIEAQEAAGQEALCAARDRLPVRGTIDRPELKEQWEAVGFAFGAPIPEPSQRDRQVFVACTFPEGWSLRPTEHAMWSDVVDAKGRKRAAVFFKAAFYDFNAHTFGLTQRFRTGSVRSGDGVEYGVIDEATGAIIHVVAAFPSEEAFYAGSLDRTQQALEWLAAHRPDHQNPLAYWD